jgi:hypothetical protein
MGLLLRGGEVVKHWLYPTAVRSSGPDLRGGKLMFRLQQAQFTGSSDSFGAALDL